MCYNILSSRLISLVTLLKKETEEKDLLGSVRPRATMQSYPDGALVNLQSSFVIVCSFPSATSFRNIIPVLPAVLTVEEHNNKLYFNRVLKSDFHILVIYFSYLGTFAKQTSQLTHFDNSGIWSLMDGS